MVENPLVTIAIPTYNRLEKLKKSLQSAFSQSYKSIEILILDNASSDGTREYLREIETKYDNLKIIFNEKNIGYAKNIEQIPQYVNGTYLLVLCDDDYIKENMISAAVNDFSGHPDAALWCCRFLVKRDNGELISTAVKGKAVEDGSVFVRKYFYRQRSFLFSAVVFKVSRLKQVDGFVGNRTSFFVDLVTIILCALNQKVLYDNDICMIASTHEAGTTYQLPAFQVISEIHKGFKEINKYGRVPWFKRIIYAPGQAFFLIMSFYEQLIWANGDKKIKRFEYFYLWFFMFTRYHVFLVASFFIKFPYYIIYLKEYFGVKEGNYRDSYRLNDCDFFHNVEEDNYQIKAMQFMVESINQVIAKQINIMIWGEAYMVATGKLYSDYLLTELSKDGVDLPGELFCEEIPAKHTETYQMAEKFIQQLLNSEWGKNIKHHDFYQKALSLRKRNHFLETIFGKG